MIALCKTSGIQTLNIKASRSPMAIQCCKDIAHPKPSTKSKKESCGLEIECTCRSVSRCCPSSTTSSSRRRMFRKDLSLIRVASQQILLCFWFPHHLPLLPHFCPIIHHTLPTRIPYKDACLERNRRPQALACLHQAQCKSTSLSSQTAQANRTRRTKPPTGMKSALSSAALARAFGMYLSA
jgi:hypothetical protein